MTPTTKFVMAYAGYVAGIHLIKGPWVNWSRGSVVDMWTFTHLAWSAIAKKMQVPYRTFMALSVANEGFEWYLRRRHPHLMWGTPESMANVAADLITNHIGYRMTP